jgi:predicted RNA-binding protein with PUA-like domain
MATWLFKSEPEAYSWDQLVRDKKTDWTGVRNHQANNNMKAMKKGDRGFFYHSGGDREIVGIVEVIAEHKPDPTDKDGKFGMVAIKPVTALAKPVTLAQVKADPRMAELLLVRHSRLSVSPVDAKSWKIIAALGGVKGDV